MCGSLIHSEAVFRWCEVGVHLHHPVVVSFVEDTVLSCLSGLDILAKTVRVYLWTLVSVLLL